MDTTHITVAVGLSGGVDSGIAAYLLKRDGYRVIGLTMQIWDGGLPLQDEGRSACYGPGEPRDIEAAARQAERLGIPHHVIPLADEYQTEVLAYFKREYLVGKTPSPCLICNRTVKFGFLLKKARELGLVFDRFATGHYAWVQHDPATRRFQLLRGADRSKDQSYFLARLTQDQLQQVMLPLGMLTKREVKALALELGWPDLVEKKESQNFIESADYSVLFNGERCPPGPIVDLRGRVLGEHRGIVHYTVGQRKGLGIGGAGEPLYVVRIDACANTVVVGGYNDLFTRELQAADLNWISIGQAPRDPLRVWAKIRQQHKESPASVAPSGTDPDAVSVNFDEPQMSITPGQFVVFYENDRVVGSGVIQGA
jgi:tRNA-uridine 2-sulfurtransferase